MSAQDPAITSTESDYFHGLGLGLMSLEQSDNKTSGLLAQYGGSHPRFDRMRYGWYNWRIDQPAYRSGIPYRLRSGQLKLGIVKPLADNVHLYQQLKCEGFRDPECPAPYHASFTLIKHVSQLTISYPTKISSLSSQTGLILFTGRDIGSCPVKTRKHLSRWRGITV